MKYFNTLPDAILTLITILLALLVAVLIGINFGYDKGEELGFNKAIIQGHMRIDCKFQTRCQLDYERGYQEGLTDFMDTKCNRRRSDEPVSVTL